MSELDESTSPAPAPTRDTSRGRRWGRRTGLALTGTLAGLMIAEAGFSLRDDGAFPHLNAYQADPQLGTRLEPGAAGKLSVAGGPAIEFTINSAGFRGPEWSGKSPDDIVVVGDSQVWGLGVAEPETFSARLGKALSRNVINAGVPTYGPPEYHAVAERLLKARGAKTLVYVVNVANDLFEARRPNRQRHAVWDGWAVRLETAPQSVSSFPGRDWLYRKSHAVFAWRKFWYDSSHPELDDAAFPSEGGWKDLVALGEAAKVERQKERHEQLAQAQLRPVRLEGLERDALRAQLEVEKVIYDEIVGNDGNLALLLRAARATPGDIVTTGPGEEAAPLGATAKLIREGANYRKKLEQQLRKKATELEDAARKSRITATLAERDRLAERLVALRAAPLHIARSSSPLSKPISELKALCDASGVTLVVVVLPLDVQVSSEEWKKYEGEPVDMTSTDVLTADVVGLTEALGVRVLDATAALKKAEPGAFLDGDLHLSAKGHQVVARALESKLQEAPPTVRNAGLPKGSSRLPRLADWKSRHELIVTGSDAAGCSAWQRNEWFLISCKQWVVTHDSSYREQHIHGVGSGPLPLGVELVVGGGPEVFTSVRQGVVNLIAPVRRGMKLVADFLWEGQRRRLSLEWPKGQPAASEITLRKQSDLGTIPTPPSGEDPACTCHKSLSKADDCKELVALRDADCERTYAGKCEALLACAGGDPLSPPSCPPGQVNAFAAERCLPVCDSGGGCSQGKCVAWQGLRVCAP